jgi:hypothetical protein
MNKNIELHQFYIYIGNLNPGLYQNLLHNSRITKTYFVGTRKVAGPFEYIDWSDFKSVIDDEIVDFIEKNPYKICDFKPFHIFWFQNYLKVKFDFYIICDLDMLLSPNIPKLKIGDNSFIGLKNYAHFRMFCRCDYQLSPPEVILVKKNCAFDERDFYFFLLNCGFNQIQPNAIDVNIYSFNQNGSFFQLTEDSLYFNNLSIDYLHIQKRVWPIIQTHKIYYLNGKFISLNKLDSFFCADVLYPIHVLFKRIYDKIIKEKF